MRKLVYLISVIILANPVYAQTELKSNQFEGYIIMSNGDRQEGIIEIKNIREPWRFQETFKFFDKSLLSGDKVKKSEKMECKPGEVIEYGFGDKRYVLVSYTNNNQAQGNALTTGISAIKSATQTQHFAEVYREGKVSLYRFYNSPPAGYVTVGEEEAEEMKSFIEDCKKNYDILIEKGDEKAKSFEDVLVKKFFKDCPFVVEKYEDNKYTKKPVKGLKSMIKSSLLRGEPLAAAALEMVIDYEANCMK
jgi:hypothetical protein